MKKLNHNNVTSYAVLISLALLTAGCDTAEKKAAAPQAAPTARPTIAENEVVLLSITENGQKKPLITEAGLAEYIDMAIEANPQLRMVIEMMPDAEHLIFTGQKRSKVLREWVKKTGIENQEDYKKQLDMIIDMARSNLDAQFFQKQIKVDVSDGQIRKYYDEHKNEMPGLLISPEGVKAQGVFFESADKAKAFMNKLNQPGAKFDTVAAEFKVTIDDLGGTLSERSFVDKTIKDKILALKKFPTTEMVTVDKNKVWVIKALSKEKAQYAPFDQVKENLRSMLQEQEMGKAFEKEIDKLEKQYGIEENKPYFEAKKKMKDEERQKAEQAAAAQAQPAKKELN